MGKRRVVITGMGTVSPFGVGIDTFWQALKAGQSGIRPIEYFDASGLTTQFSGHAYDYDPLEHFSTKEARTLSRFVQLSVVASRESAKNANYDVEKLDAHRVGVVIGSGIGSIRSAEEEYQKCIDKGPTRMSPFFIPKMIINEAAGQVSIDLGAKGLATCVVTACATATNSIGEAFRLIQWDEMDMIFSGGTESASTMLGMGGFGALKALSRRNDAPEKASRPFDLDRDGFVMAEGAGTVVLEELEHAKKRGAPILAEIVGYGRTADAFHATAPEESGDGAARAMQLALEDAKLSPQDVSYINAHGTSTKLNDKVETAAVKKVFGDHAANVPMSSTKSMTGHLLGAAGAIELQACIKAIEENIMPPTINYETPDPDCDLDYVPNEAREGQVDVCMSNSLGFGGHNATLVIKRFEE